MKDKVEVWNEFEEHPKAVIVELLLDIRELLKIRGKIEDIDKNLSNSASHSTSGEPNENLNQSICQFCGSKDKVEYHNGYGYTCQICKENQID